MNKLEYLSSLKEALKDTDESVMEEIISDYEEHFQVGMENGKSEEQICEELGAINDLVEEIKEVYQTDNKEEKKAEDDQSNAKNKSFKDWYSGIHNIDGEKIGGVINSALDSAGDAISKIDVFEIGNTLKNTLDQATSSLNKFADSYFKNQGMDPFDSNNRNSEGYRENVSKSYGAYAEPEEEGKDHVSYDADIKPATEDNSGSQADTQNKSCCEEGLGSGKSGEEADTAVKGNNCGEAVNAVGGNGSGEAADTVGGNVSGEAADTAGGYVSGEAADIAGGKSYEESSNIAKEENQEEAVKAAYGNEDEEPAGKENENTGMNLIIDGICANITLQRSANHKINIDYVNNGNDRQRQMYEFYSYKEGNTVYAGIRRVGKAVFLFNLKQNTININAEIPENMSSISIKTASGDIEIADVDSDRITASTASGDIIANRISATDCKIKAFSGDINLEDINSIRLNADTTGGDVKAKNIDAKFVTLKSTSGDVKAGNLNADIIDSSSLSGDLDIAAVKVKECKIRSTSGDVYLKECLMSNADVSSISGDIKLPDITGDGLCACSASGDIEVRGSLKRCHASSKSGSVEVRCLGDIILEASSTSGDVNVKLNNDHNGYSIQSRTTSGELYINYNNIHQRNLKSGTYTYGNQGSELAISSVSGDIRVSD